MKQFCFTIILIFFLNYSFSQKSPSDVIDVQEYTIVLDFTKMDNSEISGYTNIKLKPTKENTNIIKLDLLHLDIDSIIFDSEKLSYNYNDTIIEINLNQNINPDNEIDLTVFYHGNPVTDPSGWGGFYFKNGYAFNLGVAMKDIPHNYGRVWFPCNDDFVDRASYHFFITTKQEHTAICNGEFISVSENQEKQTKTYEWKINETIPTYLASVAVGDYSCYSSTYTGVEKEIPVDIYVSPNNINNAEKSFKNINEVLSIFESKFGAYKWNRVGYVSVPFNSGAMEHATSIAMGDIFIDGTLSWEYLFYHELGHHWFGDLITCSSAEDMWINEGLTTYCETIYKEFLYGKDNALDYRRNAHLSVLKDYNLDDGGFLALYPMATESTYSSTVYQKGASVAHALRGYLGDDMFFLAMKEFLNTFSYKAVSSYDLRDFLTQYTGIDMTDFFDDWVFSGGFVHYSIDSTNIVKNNENFDVTVYIKQKLRGRTKFANSNRVEISFLDNEFNATTKIMKFDGEFGEQTFSLPFDPVLVLCDYYEVTSDATTDLAKIISNTGEVNFKNTLFRANVVSQNENEKSLLRVTHNFAAPDLLKTDIPGLIISDNRFWLIEGKLSGSFKAKGEFSYSNTQDLDFDLITNSLDSLVLLYRPDRASDWCIEPASRSGSLKKFTVDSLKLGEYTLGIYDWKRYVNISTSQPFENICVYPNPNNGNFYIDFNENFDGFISIYNISGQKVFTKNYNNINDKIEIKTNIQSNGIYFLELRNTKNNKIENTKIIIKNIKNR